MKLQHSKQARVPLDEAKRRALDYLRKNAGWSQRPMPASWVADAIWPEHEMKRQGAGAAASRILKHLEKDKLVTWRSANGGWGWSALPHEK